MTVPADTALARRAVAHERVRTEAYVRAIVLSKDDAVRRFLLDRRAEVPQ